VICPHCGVQALAGNRFCHRCRGRLAPVDGVVARSPRAAPPDAGREPPRPRAFLLLALVDLLTCVLCLLMALAGAVSFFEGKDAATDLALTGVCALLGLALLLGGLGLLLRRPVGRVVHLVLGGLSLPLVPLGTAIGGLFLAWFARSGAAALFSDDPSRRRSPEARAAAASAHLVGWAAALAALVPVALTVGVTVFLLRDKPAAPAGRVESAAIAELRAAAAAERAWADLDGGRYAELSCLAAPPTCRPEFPDSTPPFLDVARSGPGPRNGYRFSFHPSPIDGRPRFGLASYALVASAEPAGAARWLCVDARGRVCAGSGERPGPAEARCPTSCSVLP
jgi:hypothetical protein